MANIEIHQHGERCTIVRVADQNLVLLGDEPEALAAALDAHLQEKEQIEAEAELLASAPMPSTLTHY